MAEKEEKNKHIKVEGQEPEAKKEEETQTSEKETEEKANDKAEDEKGADAEKQEDPLEKANKEIADLKDKYLRTLAEFDNYKKRTLKEKAELILNGSEKTVKAVLPVLDTDNCLLGYINRTRLYAQYRQMVADMSAE